jgi:hypothetical protein
MKSASVRELQDFLLAAVNNLPNVTTKYKGWLPNPTLPSDGQVFAALFKMVFLFSNALGRIRSDAVWSDAMLPLTACGASLDS